MFSKEETTSVIIQTNRAAPSLVSETDKPLKHGLEVSTNEDVSKRRKVQADDKSEKKERRKLLLVESGYIVNSTLFSSVMEQSAKFLKSAGEQIIDAKSLETMHTHFLEALKNWENSCALIEQADPSFGAHIYEQTSHKAEAKEQSDKFAYIKRNLPKINFIHEKIRELELNLDLLTQILENPACFNTDKNAITDDDLHKISVISTLSDQIIEGKRHIRDAYQALEKNSSFYSVLFPLVKNAITQGRLTQVERLEAPLMRCTQLVRQRDALAQIASQSQAEFYSKYIERLKEGMHQELIDIKNSITKKPVTVVTQRSLFAQKMSQLRPHSPTAITTWKRGLDTSVQQVFLKELLGDKAIKKALKMLKHDFFNISFLEYVKDSQYRIIFALSGSNEALSDTYFSQGKAAGINGLIAAFVKNWNGKNPGIIFEYVVGYNGSNLKMDEGGWYCSEPKLAIEHSKMKQDRGMQFITGQNNWSINPKTADLSYEEHDACTRHCQPRQSELLGFVPSPGSPTRIVN